MAVRSPEECGVDHQREDHEDGESAFDVGHGVLYAWGGESQP